MMGLWNDGDVTSRIVDILQESTMGVGYLLTRLSIVVASDVYMFLPSRHLSASPAARQPAESTCWKLCHDCICDMVQTKKRIVDELRNAKTKGPKACSRAGVAPLKIVIDHWWWAGRMFDPKWGTAVRDESRKE